MPLINTKYITWFMSISIDPVKASNSVSVLYSKLLYSIGQ